MSDPKTDARLSSLERKSEALFKALTGVNKRLDRIAGERYTSGSYDYDRSVQSHRNDATPKSFANEASVKPLYVPSRRLPPMDPDEAALLSTLGQRHPEPVTTPVPRTTFIAAKDTTFMCDVCKTVVYQASHDITTVDNGRPVTVDEIFDMLMPLNGAQPLESDTDKLVQVGNKLLADCTRCNSIQSVVLLDVNKL